MFVELECREEAEGGLYFEWWNEVVYIVFVDPVGELNGMGVYVDLHLYR